MLRNPLFWIRSGIPSSKLWLCLNNFQKRSEKKFTGLNILEWSTKTHTGDSLDLVAKDVICAVSTAHYSDPCFGRFGQFFRAHTHSQISFLAEIRGIQIAGSKMVWKNCGILRMSPFLSGVNNLLRATWFLRHQWSSHRNLYPNGFLPQSIIWRLLTGFPNPYLTTIKSSHFLSQILMVCPQTVLYCQKTEYSPYSACFISVTNHKISLLQWRWLICRDVKSNWMDNTWWSCKSECNWTWLNPKYL